MEKLSFKNNFVVNLSLLLNLRDIVRRLNILPRKHQYTKEALPLCLFRETASTLAVNPLLSMI